MPTPEEVNERTRGFLRDHPDAHSAVEKLLEREETKSLTFDDVELDSGRFGELVSRGIVEQTDGGGYRLRHPEAIEAALAGESIESETGPSVNVQRLRSALIEFASLRELGGLLGVLVLVAGARLLAYDDVFRDGHVVSPGNDPYYYRYWQEQLLARSDGVADVEVLADIGGAATGRPLTHTLNWWLAELLGGTPEAAATVAAWLPVIGAVALGCVVYVLAKLLTGDSRVGMLAVAFLGLAPVHVVYTHAGFLEHRLHQYFWLGVLVLALSWLAVDLQRRRESRTENIVAAKCHLRSRSSWIVAGVVAFAVGASAHIWTGSPLTFVPVAIYIALRTVSDVRADVPPLFANGPAIVGLAGGSLLAIGAHVGLGWHNSLAALTPALVAVGAVAVIGVGELWHRLERPAYELLAIEGVVAIAGLAGLFVFELIEPSRITNSLTQVFFREGATETTSLFAVKHAVILGPLWQIGLPYYFGLAALAVATTLVVQRYEPAWLLSVCFAWYYMALAAFQVRFAAQLVLFSSLFAAVSGVYLLAHIGLIRSFVPFARDEAERDKPFKIPGGRTSGYLFGTIGLLLILNLILVPSLVGQVTYSDEQFEAALTIDEHADEMDRSYPETAVDTAWGDVRMYNYFVNGESSSYGSRYEQLLGAEHPDGRADGLRQNGKYVVVSEREDPSSESYEILFEGLGVGHGDVETTSGRFQPVYVGDSHRAFTVVEGAVLNVSSSTATSVTASTVLEVNDEEIMYERHGEIENGYVEIRVAHPGEYTIGTESRTVNETAVHTGEQIEVHLD
ncbi:hypothetical protein KM295_06245 [Natronomonas sp. F2-12]|uniref:Dolichyl-diphosphooligosaccharide--protein glycosyltransferase n=1 Tax=Natronomonas aquatica TaxID=2841590 RepID=A0A9R1CSR3_9EURY|nr:hypothetical protein [Natronomonas aquatica]MCQ4333102.1 hypothetical protein [Natronomonas aquatica]